MCWSMYMLLVRLMVASEHQHSGCRLCNNYKFKKIESFIYVCFTSTIIPKATNVVINA